MASRKPYECFRCRDNGFPNIMVYLAGKDEQGKTIQLEEDGMTHQHKYKGKEQGQPSTQSSTSPVETKTLTIDSTAAAAHRIHRIVQNLFVQY